MSNRRPIFATLFLTLVGLAGLFPSAAAAESDGASQVEIQARILEVRAEFLASLGIAFNPADANYEGTGAQAPADTRSTGVSGSGGGGLNLMAVLYPDGGGPFGAGPAAVGFGATAEGFYANQERLVGLRRHSPPGEPDDVKGSRAIESAVDLTAAARIPLAVVPRVGADGAIVLALQPFVGATFANVETSLYSDQTLGGGEDRRASESRTKAGVVTGVGVTAEFPLLQDIPVLAGLFYKARRIPGGSVSLESNLGFTEELRVRSSWQHSVNLMIMVPVTLVSDPFSSD